MKNEHTKEEEAEIDRVLDLMDQPIDTAVAEGLLLEVRQVMDDAKITFFLRQGTCLGAVRDNCIIPWDDDIDVGSVFGLHGFNKGIMESARQAFKKRGFLTRVVQTDYFICLTLVKASIRIDWCCYWIIDDAVVMYPAVLIPVHLLTDLKEIEFLGAGFLVPNPPEEYLQTKYGKDWQVPKRAGDYEEDILNIIPDGPVTGHSGNLTRLLAKYFPWMRTTRIRVLDERDIPVRGAEIKIAGLGVHYTSRQGVIRLYIPRFYSYALAVSFTGHKNVLYMEYIRPGQSYIYRAGEEHLLADDNTW